MKIYSICRGCLEEDNLTSIFETQEVETNIVKYSDMFKMCTSMTVDELDGHPTFICAQCIEKLESAYLFRLQCLKSYDYFLNHLNSTKIEIEIVDVKEDGSHDSCDNVLENLDSPPLIVKEEEKEEPVSDDSPPQKVVKTKRKRTRKRVRVEEEIKCQYCDVIFQKKRLLNIHLRKHFITKSYFCDVCDKEYTSVNVLKFISEDGKTFKCKGCDKKFSYRSSKVYKCDFEGCTKQFISKMGIQRHRDIHNGVGYLVCHICSNKYKDKSCLELHIRRHNNEKNYDCPHCDKKFYSSSARARHINSHLKKRNYPCPNCDHRSMDSTALKKHILTHTKELTAECRICFKKFARSDNRNMHERLVHKIMKNDGKNDVTPKVRIKERRYPCPYCDHSSYDSKQRARHMNTHTNALNAECRICFKKFSRRDNRNLHERTVHKSEKIDEKSDDV